MVGLPNFGDVVMVYPFPGRLVQWGERPVDLGGRMLPKEGARVVWSPFVHEQYKAGDLLLHPVEAEKKAEPAPLPSPPPASSK